MNGQTTDPPSAPAEPPNGGPNVEGTFDVATTEDLALFFATESVRKLHIPLMLRLTNLGKNRWSRKEEIERIRSNPPKVDADGAAYPLGDKNPLSFVFDPETRTLSCWERIVKKRGSVGRLALTGPEMAAALNAASSRTKDRGGADFAYDPIRDAISLRRIYHNPPSDRGLFYKEVSSLVATGLEWVEGRYLDMAVAISESRHPPASATGSSDGFTATLVVRHFSARPSESNRWVERYVRAWDRPHGGPAPLLISDRELLVDQTLYAFIHFLGAEHDPGVAGGVDAVFRLIAPDGTTVFADLEVPMWRGEPPPGGHLQIGDNDISLSLDGDSLTGTYRLEADVCETATNRCVKLAHEVVLLPGNGPDAPP